MSVAESTPVGQDLLTEVNIEAQHIDHVQTSQLSRVEFISLNLDFFQFSWYFDFFIP